MENSHYSPQETCWIVPLDKYKTILKDSKEGKIIPGTITKVEEIPDFVLNVFSSNYTNTIHHNNDSKENIAKLMEERIPKSLLSKLMRFQYMGVREAILKHGRVFLCDEMGLGKTIQALAICSYYKNEWPCLIICPSSLRLTWASEIHKWLNIDEDFIQVIFTTKDILRKSSKIVVASYDIISRKGIEEQIKDIKFNVVVADESHYLKNKDAQFIRIDGETKQNIRQELCEKFQNNDNIRIAVLAITAAGVGLTLNKADLVIFAELFWNPAQLLQGEDRAHRIGRVGSVDIKYLIANGTIDDMQWPLIQKKLDIIGTTIDVLIFWIT
ncbi:hypothetical protein PIROE2DRAFT_59124 [Piromyces sp. E2]|nr:hypothetical protein PIROE2DRAFT_59124 [Piromyces sp. E2]|eukprot:OUM66866.1 hypothetical protein PIROE2DRAFT_59124 [Piromyces sp. E2]